jgi:hypothetical protein
MKKLFFLFFATCLVQPCIAQEEEEMEEAPFFKKENIFVGGTVNVGFGNLTTSLGLSPFVGYSLNKYVDVAVSANLNYISQRDYLYIGDRVRQMLYGPGAFIRLFPARFLFAQAQYEFNMMRTRYIPALGSSLSNETYTIDAHSILVGAGISNGKNFPYQKSYYYFSVLWDVGKSNNSPYIDNLNRPVPIIRAGYNIALFQGRR